VHDPALEFVGVQVEGSSMLRGPVDVLTPAGGFLAEKGREVRVVPGELVEEVRHPRFAEWTQAAGTSGGESG
jgi:hypothetical protein